MKFKQGEIIEINPTEHYEKGYVYALLDPKTEIPFYVGRSFNPYARLLTHRAQRKRYRAYKGTQIKFKMKILEVIDINGSEKKSKPYQELVEREAYWIWKLKKDGLKLENKTDTHLDNHKSISPFEILPVPSNIVKRREMMDRMFGPLSDWIPSENGEGYNERRKQRNGVKSS